MAKTIEFTLTTDELEAVETAMKKDKRPEVRRRATAVRLLHLGHKPPAVAEMVSASQASIYGWWGRWQKGGVEGLANKAHKPPKRKADGTYRQALAAALDQEPSALAYDFSIWTRERLRDHLKRETGVELSCNWLGEVMKAEGYEWRRPKHDLTHLQNQEKKVAKELLEELKKTSSQTISSFSLWTKPL
jgi:transposase